MRIFREWQKFSCPFPIFAAKTGTLLAVECNFYCR